MRLAAIIILSGLILFLSTQIYSFLGRERDAAKTFSEYQAKLRKATFDKKKLEEELRYYSNQENLEKELKGRFNYKEPDEKLIIIVPKNQSTTAQ
ncbi:MAG: hypothetical protein HY434_01740 [Candidatus Liptonbacteria bacterium]|nr:hypothetical protein [Candidatus Liptonbacteria bacterium]